MTNDQHDPKADPSSERPAGAPDDLEEKTEKTRSEQSDLNTKYDALKQEPGADNQEPEGRQ